MLSAGRCSTSGHDAAVGVPNVVCRRFVVAVGCNVRRECRRTYWSLQQRSAVWPGDAGVSRDRSCAAPLIARAARHAAIRVANSRCMNNANSKSASHVRGGASTHLLQRLGSVDVRLWR